MSPSRWIGVVGQGGSTVMANINEGAEQLTAVPNSMGDQTVVGEDSKSEGRDTSWQTAYSFSAPALRKALMSTALISQPLNSQPLNSQPQRPFTPDSTVP